MEWNQFSIARTDDGVAWVPYVRTYRDVTFTDYQYSCDDSGCHCRATQTERNGWRELRLLRVAPDAPPESVLVLNLSDPGPPDFGESTGGATPMVRVRAASTTSTARSWRNSFGRFTWQH
ncbi:MAG: hypothetical protein DRI90_20215 [Deltaproteobacteria bacterium]|nr:MAG: hypothetical protein DRI90_20215 [Deltaproteobacteria bacterium]